jgi:hypothetical protein
MSADLIAHLIFMIVILGLLFLMSMASEANNKAMTRVWGSAIGLALLIHLTL